MCYATVHHELNLFESGNPWIQVLHTLNLLKWYNIWWHGSVQGAQGANKRRPKTKSLENHKAEYKAKYMQDVCGTSWLDNTLWWMKYISGSLASLNFLLPEHLWPSLFCHLVTKHVFRRKCSKNVSCLV